MMRAPFVLIAAAAAMFLWVGCGANTATPLRPSTSDEPAPAPAPTLSIKPDTTGLKLGESVTFSAVETQSNGTEQTVPATWMSDRPEVLRIEPAGNARGNTLGEAVITAVVA